MTKVMPQEIEVWYLLPALRKELAKVFIRDFHLTQKEAANILGLSEPAVSQYLKSKRATTLKFSRDELKQIKETAKKIINDKEKVMEYIYNLCIAFRGSKTICDLHRIHEKGISKKCDICFEE